MVPVVASLEVVELWLLADDWHGQEQAQDVLLCAGLRWAGAGRPPAVDTYTISPWRKGLIFRWWDAADYEEDSDGLESH